MEKKVILFLSTITVLCSCSPPNVKKIENGFEAKIQEGPAKVVKIEAIDDNIIHVTASPKSTFSKEVNLIKDPTLRKKTNYSIEQKGDTIQLSTPNTKAYLLKSNGKVWFTNKDGNVLLSESEKNKEFVPMTADSVSGYSVSLSFDGDENEGLYGLGQHQSDEFNYKGKNEELFQYNTKVSVPFIISSDGYGVLWHNYSLSRFGNKNAYEDLDVLFDLKDKDNNAGALTASYYKDEKSHRASTPQQTRKEGKIDYENLKTIKNFPDGFPTNDAFATWEGSLQPKESGTYNFKLHYAGYAKVFIDNKEVITERWRTAWNPNDYKAHVEMEKGKTYPIRIEWRPDGDVSYMGLKALPVMEEADTDKITFWSEMADEIDYYFINGSGNMDKVIGGYRELTGKSPIMPKWAMGFWLSRERYHTQEELLTALGEYRKQQIPLDVIVQDWSYWPKEEWGSHKFDKERFPDPKGMVEEIHDKDARIMISVWPKFYMTTDNYKELDAIGAMYQQAIKDSIRDWIYPGYIGSFYDAYNPEARKIFWNQMNDNLYSLGIDAWWMDASEPNVQDNTDIEYRKALCGPTYLGPSTKYFNAYALMNAEAIYDGQRSVNPKDRVFLLTRSGFAGQQRYSTATWSGDIGTRWEDMKAQISAGLNFAMSGIPYWTMDIGGFCVEKRYEKATEGSEDMKEWRELNNRWYQFGAFCPLFRSHGQYPYREIYNISKPGSHTYESMKYYTNLRYQLIPYIYSLASKTHFDDYTIMRALVMDYPTDKNVRNIDDQFMFGPSFMACPVYQYKARERDVYFPAGTWYDFYSGESFAGGESKKVAAPYERIPLYVPAGSIIPTGDVVQSTAQPQKDLTIYVYAGKDGAFTIYEDDGTTYGYENKEFAQIPLDYNESSKQLNIGKREGSYLNMPSERNIKVVYITPSSPAGTVQQIAYKGEAQQIKL